MYDDQLADHRMTICAPNERVPRCAWLNACLRWGAGMTMYAVPIPGRSNACTPFRQCVRARVAGRSGSGAASAPGARRVVFAGRADGGLAPRLFAHSAEVAALIGLDASDIASPEFARVFCGNAIVDGMQPYAANYGGHQFGHWAGQLGDGRAITLGECVNGSGERWELQLKGAGPTPYSRTADGRAVLRSSIREFLCGEAMHHLGVHDHACPEPGRDRRSGRARHVLRRQPEGRAWRGRLPRRALVHPLRQFRTARFAWRRKPAAPTR